MINIFQPAINVERAVEKFRTTLQSNWIGRGKIADEFETKLSEYLGVKRENVYCLGSCTDAIFNIFRTLNLPTGSEVIIPSNSFPAVGSAILASGLIPRIIDINLYDGNVDLTILKDELSLRENISAVFLTDYGGVPVPSSDIRESMADEIKLLIDAAASFGSSFVKEDKYLHPEADFVCYSFDAMKLLTTGEGGMVVIKDQFLMNKFKEQTYLGLPVKKKSGMDSASDGKSFGWWEYDITMPGERSILNDISAGLGIVQMQDLDEKINRRSFFREIYENELKIPQIEFLKNESEEIIYSNYFMTILAKKRDELASYLLDNKIYTTYRYWPLHKMSFFRNYCSSKGFPNTDILCERALNLPIHNGLEQSEIDYICSKIKSFYNV